MSIKLTDKQMQTILDLARKLVNKRTEVYERAVEVYEKNHPATSRLSKKIAEGEVNNLLIARPTIPKPHELKSQAEYQRYVKDLRNQLRYGVERAEQKAIYNYIGAVRKAWGNESANIIESVAQQNPSKFIDLVNSGKLPSIRFLYKITDEEAQDDYIDTLITEMDEEDYEE